jgi:phosphohistidine phosphatase
MIVYFVRHASAGQHKANSAKDEKRPLDRDGVQQAHQIGRLLAALNVDVDVVISSPLKRAMQTASLIANEVSYELKIERDAALRPEATFDVFRHLLAKYEQKEAIMVVGHNPSITAFLSLVVSRGDQDELVDFKKGAVARVEMTGRKSGVLHWCVTPKLAAAAYEAAMPSPSANGHRNSTPHPITDRAAARKSAPARARSKTRQAAHSS